MSNNISDLIRKSWGENNPSGWFEPIYANAAQGTGSVPWARMQPFPLFIDWLEENQIKGNGKTALVIGCGLGDDAQALNQRGFDVTAFDISQTAIDWSKQRFPNSGVDYQVADLFDLPDDWKNTFDLVLEIFTIQSLPYDIYPKAMEVIASLVKENGTLLVICLARRPEQPYKGIPWPLSTKELDTFTKFNLTEESIDEYQQQFRVEYSRSK